MADEASPKRSDRSPPSRRQRLLRLGPVLRGAGASRDADSSLRRHTARSGHRDSPGGRPTLRGAPSLGSPFPLQPSGGSSPLQRGQRRPIDPVPVHCAPLRSPTSPSASRRVAAGQGAAGAPGASPQTRLRRSARRLPRSRAATSPDSRPFPRGACPPGRSPHGAARGRCRTQLSARPTRLPTLLSSPRQRASRSPQRSPSAGAPTAPARCLPAPGPGAPRGERTAHSALRAATSRASPGHLARCRALSSSPPPPRAPGTDHVPPPLHAAANVTGDTAQRGSAPQPGRPGSRSATPSCQAALHPGQPSPPACGDRGDQAVAEPGSCRCAKATPEPPQTPAP